MRTKYLDIEKVNEKIKIDASAYVDECENFYRDQLKEIANDILSQKKPVKVILLGGPSCAGKTTSSRLLDDLMTEQGKNVVPIEMDNFFISLAERPRMANGSLDFDSINIVNLELMEKCFTELFEKGKAKFPVYDFIEGKSIPNSELIEADSETIIILEGIHVLNPKLIKKLGTKAIYKIFINNANGYKYKNTKIEPRQFRMIRRMVRDVQFRAVSMANTVKHWKDVTDAEDLYIIPHSTKVNSTINTSHGYEVNLFKQDIDKALEKGEISKETLPWLEIFEKVDVLDKEILPETTLMKEFVSFDK